MPYTPPSFGANGPLIQSTANVISAGVKALIYGKAGAGKTVLLSTIPNNLILSAEQGLLSLRRFNLPFIEIKSMADLQGARQWVAGSREAQQFTCISLDSVSEIAEILLGGEKGKSTNTQRAYGEMADQIIDEFRQFRQMDRHVIFTAKMGMKKDGMSGAMQWGPSFPGQKLDQEVPYLFDEMFQLTIGTDPTTGQNFRVLRTQPDNQNEAKDRSGSLDLWEPPDLRHVFNKIMGIH